MMDANYISERLSNLKQELSDLRVINARYWSRSEHSPLEKSARASHQERLLQIKRELSDLMKRCASIERSLGSMVRKPFKCTDCGSVEGYRSRPRNFIEKYILPVLGLRPVRCPDCFRRSYQPFFVIVRERSEAEVRRRSAA